MKVSSWHPVLGSKSASYWICPRCLQRKSHKYKGAEKLSSCNRKQKDDSLKMFYRQNFLSKIFRTVRKPQRVKTYYLKWKRYRGTPPVPYSLDDALKLIKTHRHYPLSSLGTPNNSETKRNRWAGHSESEIWQRTYQSQAPFVTEKHLILITLLVKINRIFDTLSRTI